MLLVEKLLGSSSAETPYIEDVFSTFLYDGNGSTQTITNGIDLAGIGGLVWLKGRSDVADHALYDTARGATFDIGSNLATGQTTQATGVTAFSSTGFSIGLLSKINTSGELYVNWTFRKQPKFFDVVTYTGNGANRTIPHSLGSVPGCIMVKRTDTTGDWQVYHRSLANTQYMVLNRTDAPATGTTRWNSTTPTSTVFSLGTDTTVNANGGTYVAYLFAHDAGGFGDTGADNAISCGSYTGNGSATGPVVTLGYEPQWLLIKNISSSLSSWILLDNTRGLVVSGNDSPIKANARDREATSTQVTPLATGFQLNSTSPDVNANNSSYVYIAIRRGPMRVPTDGTTVFNPVVYTGTNVDNRLVNTSIAPDMVFVRQRNDTVLGGMVVGDRMRGQPYLLTGTTAAQVNDPDSFDRQEAGSGGEYGTAFSSMGGFWCGNDATAKLNVNTTSNNHVVEAFRRAPGFFDVVAYTGTGSAKTEAHNLGVIPELMIVKNQGTTGAWQVYAGVASEYLVLNTTAGRVTGNTDRWNGTAPTASVFSLGTDATVNASANTYIAYLFASCPGVSKVGTYTGTGATLTIDCGFAAGARLVLIKRTDNTGDWFIWDTARGIVAANDPYLRLSSTGAEVTNTDWVDPASAGFELSSAVGNSANISGASYVFLAIA